jgi:DtxR family Mn-dependent transcriptional regulator
VTELIDTTEMYLRIILELEEERVTPMRARIAERLAHSGPTVSQTIARMELATRVMRKHRIAERLLVDILGLELEYVHDEACRWEHVISERVERKILALLDDGRESPYGNPIPGLDELGLAPGEVTASVSSLLDLAGDVDRPVTVRRIGEPAQTDPAASASLRDAGVLPGAVVQIVRQGPGVLVRGDREAYLGPRLASYVFAS